ncbi:MAG: hypothetical protein LBU68_01055, partial [Rickettsiales bacterium]|nr:hypothetical protein [Rickettsiales bacterium]
MQIKTKISNILIMVTALLFVLPVLHFENDAFAQRRPAANRSTARAGGARAPAKPVARTAARSGSTKAPARTPAKPAARTTARSGSTGGSSARPTVARSGSTGGSARAGASRAVSGSLSSNSNRNIKRVFLPSATTAAAGDDKAAGACIYSYVNCMDAMIHYVLKKNPYLDNDKAVEDLIVKDKPFRCVFAIGNANSPEDKINIADGYISFTKSEDDTSNSIVASGSSFANILGGNAGQQSTTAKDWAATALYKQYNYFCSEKDNILCDYDFGSSNTFFASKQSTAYYMDIYSRIRGGCSNGAIEWDPEGSEDDLNKECLASSGRWYQPNSLKMTDMNNNLMGELGFASNDNGKCYTTQTQNACRAAGGVWEGSRCVVEEANAETCDSEFRGVWEKTKEWSFAVNVPPPSMTLNPKEEFAMASSMCFVGATDELVVKSKRIAQFTENLRTKGIPQNVISSVVEPVEGDKMGYIEALASCGDYRANLEEYYQTGVWKNADGTEKLDDFFKTAPQSCFDYSISLKSVRQTW